MRQPTFLRFPSLSALAAVAAAAVAATALSTPTLAPPLLQAGSHSQRVRALQWLLAGHRPNVFTSIAGTYRYKPNGLYGRRTAAAVYAYKYRLGYPARFNPKAHPVAGQLLFDLLEGKRTRPGYWVALAAERLKAIEAAAPSPRAVKVRAEELLELGVEEHPLGSNWGTTPGPIAGSHTVAQYQAVTGALHAAWCVSFQQAMFKWAGYGTFAHDTPSVYQVVDYAAPLNWLHAKPRVGALVAFVDYDANGQRIPGSGHIGYVIKVGAGWYVSVEGNQANGVHEIFHRLGDRGNVFVYLPGVA